MDQEKREYWNELAGDFTIEYALQLLLTFPETLKALAVIADMVDDNYRGLNIAEKHDLDDWECWLEEIMHKEIRENLDYEKEK